VINVNQEKYVKETQLTAHSILFLVKKNTETFSDTNKKISFEIHEN
jgi:hypothetical protein